jgi:hypothetical protein
VDSDPTDPVDSRCVSSYGAASIIHIDTIFNPAHKRGPFGGVHDFHES